MNLTRDGALPAPHDCISVHVCPFIDDAWVEYRGTQQQLVAAGLLTPFMLRKVETQKRGARKDERGVQFKLWHYPGDDKQFLTLRRQPKLRDALELPGVRELYPDGIPECGKPTGAIQRRERSPYRSRRVGRLRRLVNWCVIDNVLIIPNWGEIRAARP